MYIWSTLGYNVLSGLILLVATLLVGLLVSGIDRILAARLQARIGPPIVQPWRDLVKLMSKKTIIPAKATGWLYNFAPVMTLMSVLLLVLYLPFFDVTPLLSSYGDIIVVLYLLMMPAIAMVVGGFASGNRYATIGAQRKIILMMSYELPLAVLIVGAVWFLNQVNSSGLAFSFSTFSQYPLFSSVGAIGFIGVILLFVSLFVSLCAELIKTPFDAPEADTELAEGLLVEYSGRNLALFNLADMVKLGVFVTLVIGLFFPYQLSSFVDLGGWVYLGNALFFLLKFLIISVFGLTFVRVAFARLKITQITKFFWLISTGISLLGFLLLYVEVLL